MSEKNPMILNKRIKVLDAGHVELCDYMGDDEAIVRCARQSYNKDEEDLSDHTIARQIEEMLKNGHSSPFEQVVFRFHLRTPIFVARQIVRHRTARLNELSGRYTEFSEDSFHVPDETALINRLSYDEYSSSVAVEAQALKDDLSMPVKKANEFAFKTYKELIGNKIPREVARVVLPLSLYTEFYWQMDLHNLMHFLELRLEEHAQAEIREFAYAIYYFANKVCPISIKHFTENKLNKIVLGENDIKDLLLEGVNLVHDRSKCTVENRIRMKYETIKHRNSLIKVRLNTFDKQLNLS